MPFTNMVVAVVKRGCCAETRIENAVLADVASFKAGFGDAEREEVNVKMAKKVGVVGTRKLVEGSSLRLPIIAPSTYTSYSAIYYYLTASARYVPFHLLISDNSKPSVIAYTHSTAHAAGSRYTFFLRNNSATTS